MKQNIKYCRICLRINIQLTPVFNYRRNIYLPQVVWNVSGVKILPEETNAQICEECAEAILAAETIILRCQQSEDFLYDLKQQERKNNNIHTTKKKQKENELVSTDLIFTNDGTETNDLDKRDDSVESKDDFEVFEEDICNSRVDIEPKNVQHVSGKRRHERYFPKLPLLVCEICKFKTKTGKQLIAHRLKEHQIDDNKIYSCKICTKRFSWKPTLYRHIQEDHNTLPAEKKFFCKKCGKAYTREVHLREHFKQRHQPRRFKCADLNCKQTFTRAFTLRRHYLATHADKKPYHCPDCNKYFKIYDLWKYHNEVVHKNAIVYCPRCGYPFRHKEKLEEHLENNVCSKSVIPCDYCQRRFTTKGGLREHLRNIHQIESN